MDALSYKTISANVKTVKKEWLLVDATDAVLGRLSSRVAAILRGKNKTNFTPHVDCGDNVVIINAEKIKLTGKKWTDKQYITYTGYPGGQRFATPTDLLKKDPTRILENAIYHMLPKSKLGNAIKNNLHIYTGTQHPHEAQKPKAVKL